MSRTAFRAAAALLAVLLLSLCAAPVLAAQTPVFVMNDAALLAGGDILLRGGTYYIPYTVFARALGVQYSYEALTNMFLLYNSAHVVAFDLNYGTCTVDDVYYYSQRVYLEGGTFYVPLAFTASQFGCRYAYYPEGVLRVTDSRARLSAAELTALLRAQGYLPPLDTPEAPPEPPEPEVLDRSLTLLFAGIADGGAETLAAARLYRVPVAFFLTADELREQPGFVRGLVVAGMPVGLLAGPGTTPQELDAANDLLQIVAKRRTALVWYLPDEAQADKAQTLAEAGYLLWYAAPPAAEPAAALSAAEELLAVRERSAFALAGPQAGETVAALAAGVEGYRLSFETATDAVLPPESDIA